jgi:glycosyltransferase involved in cell wall biosynthesis
MNRPLLTALGRTVLGPFPSFARRLYYFATAPEITQTRSARLPVVHDPAVLVHSFYKAAFGRPAEPEGLAHRTHQLRSGVSPEDLAEELVGSAEFQNRHGSSHKVDTEFLMAMYRDSLGREPDPAGMGNWLAAGQNGATQGKVLAGIAGSAEALERIAPHSAASAFRMKVGIMVSEQLEWPEIGGGCMFEQEVVEALLRLRPESPHHFFLLGNAPEKPSFLNMSDLLWLTTSRVSTSPEQPPLFDFDLCPAVKNESLDLICYLNPWTCPFLDIPFIINIWDLAHRVYPFFPEVSLAGTWDARELHFRRRIQRAVYIITPNARGKQEITYFYQVPEDKVRTLHHPTPGYALRAAAQRAAKKSLEHLGIKGEFLLYPAQFWAHKNHVLLLRVLKSLRQKYRYEPQLVLTGSDRPLFDSANKGNKSFVAECAAELSVQNQVIFAGFVSQEDLIALYQQAVALVFPSFFGPENLPPLEAFALDCPVVASRIPGSVEQFGDAALQVDPKDPQAWADAIWKVCRRPKLRSSLIAKGRARARRFTPDDFVRGLFQIIDEFASCRCNWPSRF